MLKFELIFIFLVGALASRQSYRLLVTFFVLVFLFPLPSYKANASNTVCRVIFDKNLSPRLARFLPVAINRLSRNTDQGFNEFTSEIVSATTTGAILQSSGQGWGHFGSVFTRETTQRKTLVIDIAMLMVFQQDESGRRTARLGERASSPNSLLSNYLAAVYRGAVEAHETHGIDRVIVRAGGLVNASLRETLISLGATETNSEILDFFEDANKPSIHSLYFVFNFETDI